MILHSSCKVHRNIVNTKKRFVQVYLNSSIVFWPKTHNTTNLKKLLFAWNFKISPVRINKNGLRFQFLYRVVSGKRLLQIRHSYKLNEVVNSIKVLRLPKMSGKELLQRENGSIP